MDKLLFYLNSIHPLSPKLNNHLTSVLRSKKIQKKDLLLREGQVCKTICFIAEGAVKSYYSINEKEVCSWFMMEGDVIISVESFIYQKPSYETIQAIENTLVYYIDYEELQFIYLNYPEFNFIGRKLTEKYYSLSEERLYFLRKQKAEERYKHVLQKYPKIIQRISSQDIASYIGISLETLSRIKKRI